MSILEALILPDRKKNEGDIERQINNIIDRGLHTYLNLIAAQKIAGPLLGLVGNEGASSAASVASEVPVSDGFNFARLLIGPASTMFDHFSPKKVDPLFDLLKRVT